MRRLRDVTLAVPLEPILHASPLRLKLLGLYTMIGHPLFYFVWAHLYPQPFEDAALRALMTACGIPLVLDSVALRPQSQRSARVFTTVLFIQLPLFFSWMYFMNGHNDVWIASLATVIVIYFHLTDWRVAAAGSLLGLGVAALLALPFIETPSGGVPPSHAFVLAFAWMSGLLLGISGANLRRERIEHSLATIGIMAHELRTPLATTALIADALRMEAQRKSGEGPRPESLEKWAARLHQLTRSMNHHIDLQIANARLLQLSDHGDRISAAELVREAVAAYPYRSDKERECIRIEVHQDFEFRGSRSQFLRVIDNLLQNALRAMHATGSPLRPGGIRLEVGIRGKQGRIRVSDQGLGIAPEVLPHVLEPFYSTEAGTGHGLGLAFCRRVVESAGGVIEVRSPAGSGAIVSLTVPVAES